jgi:hypothetical protein
MRPYASGPRCCPRAAVPRHPDRAPACSRPYRASRRAARAGEDDQMADLVRIYRVGALLHLQIRSQPQRAAMALDHLGQRFCRDRMAHCLRLLSWYVANFGSYDKTYGSLGAIIGFMTWIWVSIIVVLVGAKLNAEIVWISEQEHLVTVALDPISSRYYTHSDNIAGCVATLQCHPSGRSWPPSVSLFTAGC